MFYQSSGKVKDILNTNYELKKLSIKTHVPVCVSRNPLNPMGTLLNCRRLSAAFSAIFSCCKDGHNVYNMEIETQKIIMQQ